ncbi:MAG: peptide chain release factor 2 [Peptoniphilaceae bacterium]|nr:peptide chain release factor 2 [Peptoniphilaceae bacterium]MDY3738086.1 peptide chain release factor 2 [Peptoniphilaceae bacterium]
MQDLYEEKVLINDLSDTLNLIGDSLDLDNLKIKIKNLQEESTKENFWQDQIKAQKIMRNLSNLKDNYNEYYKLSKQVDDLKDYIELMQQEEILKEDEYEFLKEELNDAKKDIESYKIRTQLNGKYDTNDAFFTIHSGAGGLEATDWAGMLLRMYERYFENEGFSYEISDVNEEEGGGIKSVTLKVKGNYAYGYLYGEKGVHRLVRISPFDSAKRRHTSFASVDVYPVLDDDLSVEIDPKDIRIDTFRASGAGGQHINKTDSAVRITHIPTGIVVSCQNERSQIQNKKSAMDMLIAKLEQIKEEEEKEKISDIQGKYTEIGWGNQIRSYVFHPYTMVKDHRTNYETGNIERVMNGEIQDFIDSYLNYKASNKK